jgi:hypothetical protein
MTDDVSRKWRENKPERKLSNRTVHEIAAISGHASPCGWFIAIVMTMLFLAFDARAQSQPQIRFRIGTPTTDTRILPDGARILQTWKCGKLVTVELRKYGTAAFELIFEGALVFSGPGNGVNFKFVGDEGAKLNGKPCRVLPYDPKRDKND